MSSFLSVLWAILRRRCPRCLEGRMFRGWFAMNDPCPKCGLLFQREEGYFLGAMYFSYVLGALLVFPTFYVAAWLLPNLSGMVVGILVWLVYLPFVPIVFQYSRVLWVTCERWGRFHDSTAGSYEKHRLEQIAAGRSEGPTQEEVSEKKEPRRNKEC